MLKYVAMLRVDNPIRWSQWESMPTALYLKSPIETDKEKVKEWLRNEERKYSNTPKISCLPNRYIVDSTIIAFDDEESQNIEEFLNRYPF